jgi:integrase
MEQLIKRYIEAHRLAWSETTAKSEASRLSSIQGWIKEDPALAFETLSKKYKPYTLKTTFIRISKFLDWAIENGLYQGPNNYSKFLKTHRNKLKHAYEKEQLNVTFQEARTLLANIKSDEVRRKAEQMLTSGLRISEAFGGLQDDGTVKGKGSKVRPYFGRHSEDSTRSISKTQFRRELKKAGLKPHTLRKLFATQLVNSGMPLQDVMRVMGWSSVETAKSYLQCQKDDAIMNEVQRIVG